MKIRSKDLTYIALFAVLNMVCSWLAIPTKPPFTMQTFSIFLTLGFLGGVKGTISIAIYILLGAIGVPAFSNFTGGVGVLFGMTGGYILGFLLSGLIFILFEKLFKGKKWFKIVAFFVGLAICYLFGTLWFVKIYSAAGDAISFFAALGVCVVPFIIPDILKILLSLFLLKKLSRFQMKFAG